jgi:glycosyltransferase involved in cell wall biosynthesis
MKDTMPKVSIVVPCFNQEAFIGETLESVKRQRFDDWECIVVNDGSTDGSQAIIDRYVKKDQRFLTFTKENGGVASARNFGFAQARGSLFVPLDGDDKLHPDFLWLCFERFALRPETDLVHTKTKRIGDSRKVWHLPSYSYEKLLWQNMIVNTSMFRRDAFLATGGYAQDMRHGFEDWEFYIRLLKPESVVEFVNLPLFYYRVKKGSRSHEQISRGRLGESQRMIFERNRDAYAHFLNNPVGVIGERIKDFAPVHTARYKRSLRYWITGYSVVAVALLLVIVFLIARR